MRCLKCSVAIRNPRGKTRDLQICASCRGELGRGDKKKFVPKIAKPRIVMINGRKRLRSLTGRYA